MSKPKVTIRRNGEQDTITVGEGKESQVIDMSGLEGKSRIQANRQFVDWWAEQNGFDPIYKA